MAEAENTLRYIKIDYTSHREAILQRIRSRWPNVWNDFLFNGQSSFGLLLVDLMAWSIATLAFLVNRAAGENFISTMTLRESAQRIGSLVGYRLRGPTPAIVQCAATLISPADSDITIKQGTLIRTGDNLPFEVEQDYTISTGETTPIIPVVTLSATDTGTNVLATNVTVTNGSVNVDLIDVTIDISDFAEVSQSIRFGSQTTVYQISAITTGDASGILNRIVIDPAYDDGTDVTTAQIITAEIFDQRITLVQGQTITDTFTSPGTESPNFAVKLTQSSILEGSIGVTVNDVDWTSVTSFFESQPDDTHYLVKTLTSESTIVQFGDGKFGSIIPTDATIVVTYRVGGGEAGNVSQGTINTSISGFVTTTSNPITILINNTGSEGEGGQEAENVEQARTNIPFFTRTNDRCVTLDDYQTLASRFSDPQLGAVAYARATIRTDNALLEGNIVIIYAWTQGSSGSLIDLSAPLKTALQEYLQTKSVGTDFVLIANGTDRPAPIALRFKVFEGFDLTETQSFVQKTIKDIIVALRPGSPIIYSDLMSAIDSTFGVDTVTMATPTNDLITNNQTELFTQPSDNNVYSIDRSFVTSATSSEDGAMISTYSAQLPVTPIQPWALRLFIGGSELTVMPDTTPGFARLFRSGILSISSSLKSTVNLLTGQITLRIKGAQGDLTAKLKTFKGYTRERFIDVYIGYTGVSTQAKRREIRSALRSWSEGFDVGGTLYTQELSGIVLSKSNVKDVVLGITGVTSVTRVALDTPSSSDTKVSAAETELLRLRQVVINNSSD